MLLPFSSWKKEKHKEIIKVYQGTTTPIGMFFTSFFFYDYFGYCNASIVCERENLEVWFLGKIFNEWGELYIYF